MRTFTKQNLRSLCYTPLLIHYSVPGGSFRFVSPNHAPHLHENYKLFNEYIQIDCKAKLGLLESDISFGKKLQNFQYDSNISPSNLNPYIKILRLTYYILSIITYGFSLLDLIEKRKVNRKFFASYMQA